MTATHHEHVGPIRDISAETIVEAARLVQTGLWYSLATSRFPGMPLFPDSVM